MAGRTLLRLMPDGELELIEVADGQVYARAQITPQSGAGITLAAIGPKQGG